MIITRVPRNLVSDDIFPDGPWANNLGITLPDDKSATHNGALSPLFFERQGYRIHSDSHIDSRCNTGYFWAKTTSSSPTSAHWLENNRKTISPSTFWNRSFANSLRYLVSTNNRIIINLVSDDNQNEAATANQGVSLPNGENATNNIGLTPLFINYSGALGNGTKDLYIVRRGRIGLVISSIAGGNRAWLVSYRLDTSDLTITPSMRNNPTSYPLSLRCLVSTNNR